MKTKQIVIGVLVLLILVMGLVGALFLVRQQQELRKNAAPATKVSILPPATTTNVGEEFALTVEMNTAANTVIEAELHITFDAQKLTLKSLTSGTFLPVVLAKPQINGTVGSATVTLGAQPANTPQGKGTLATLKFEAKAPGSATVSFGPGTQARGVQEGADIIVSKVPSAVVILAAFALTQTSTEQVTSTPTPTPTQTGGSGGGTGGTQATSTPTPTTNTGSGGGQKVGTGGTASSPTPTKNLVTTAPTVTSELPVSGVGMPTVLASMVGVLVLLLGIVLAL